LFLPGDAKELCQSVMDIHSWVGLDLVVLACRNNVMMFESLFVKWGCWCR